VGVAWAEAAARLFEPPRPVGTRQWDTPGQLARAVDPTVVQTPALDLIDSALIDVANGKCKRLIISMPPQEGKSSRVTTLGPLWFLVRNPDMRIAIASYGQDLAEEFGLAIRTLITSNTGDEGTLDLGLRIAPDHGAARRWRIAGHRGGVRSVGLAAGLTGRGAELLVIDDPIKGQADADSKVWRERVWKWWLSVANTRLAPGAPVILILTRWHEDDLAGRVLAAEDGHRWRVINIPAVADHDPAKGESDPLGREPGEFLISARGRTDEEWREIRTAVGTRVWNSLYQGRPSPVEGAVFQRGWLRYYQQPRAVQEASGAWRALGATTVVSSWDMAFKDTTTSDYVCGQVWAVRQGEAWLLDQVHGRMDFVESCRAVEALRHKWPQATTTLIEDKANGPAVISQLRTRIPGLIAINPTDSKTARAWAVSPFVESGNVLLPAAHLAPWVSDLVEELCGFPFAAHDDRVDALTQALHRLLLRRSSAGGFMSELVAANSRR
jgi:predicted phage terminase large subunit-like protein